MTVVIDVIATAKNESPLPSFGFVSRIDALQDPTEPSKLRSLGPLARKSVPKEHALSTLRHPQKIKLEPDAELHVLQFCSLRSNNRL